MADNVSITPGSGNTVGADEVTDGTLGTVKIQYVKLMDGTIDGTTKAAVGANGLKVDGSGVTQPVSGTVTTTPPANASVNLTQVGGSNIFKAQQTMANSFPVAIANDQSAIPVTGTFFQATQPVSLATAPTTPVTGTFFQATQPVSGTVAISNPVQVQSSVLVITATAATGVAVTATLPAVAAQFHYISFIEVVKYFTAANAASATPLVVTTTNIPGSLAFTLGQPLGTIGTTDRMIHAPNSPIHSSTVNTATTIVCPATTGIIWRINVYYFTAV